MGKFIYDADQNRWLVVDENAEVRHELHCGDVLRVRPWDDEDAPTIQVRIELDSSNWWYMITEDGTERDDFELLDVEI